MELLKVSTASPTECTRFLHPDWLHLSFFPLTALNVQTYVALSLHPALQLWAEPLARHTFKTLFKEGLGEDGT